MTIRERRLQTHDHFIGTIDYLPDSRILIILILSILSSQGKLVFYVDIVCIRRVFHDRFRGQTTIIL